MTLYLNVTHEMHADTKNYTKYIHDGKTRKRYLKIKKKYITILLTKKNWKSHARITKKKNNRRKNCARFSPLKVWNFSTKLCHLGGERCECILEWVTQNWKFDINSTEKLFRNFIKFWNFRLSILNFRIRSPIELWNRRLFAVFVSLIHSKLREIFTFEIPTKIWSI